MNTFPFRTKKSNHLYGNCEYQPYECQKCIGKQSNIIYKGWNDFYNFCGNFSILQNNDNELTLNEIYNFDRYLIKLEKTTNKIICKVCSHIFELRRFGNLISIYKYQCCAQVGKSCLSCYQLEKKKNYSECKKCKFKLLFIPQWFNPKIKCSRCNLKHCLYCKNVITYFSNNNCKCILSKDEQKIKLIYFFLILDVIIMITGLIAFSYLQNFIKALDVLLKIFSQIHCAQVNLQKVTQSKLQLS